MKIKKYQFKQDLVFIDGKMLLDKRFDGSKVVDIKNYTKFYIDENGIKHIRKLNNDWQELECKWNDELIKQDGQRKVKTLEDYKKEKINELYNFIVQCIDEKYPKEQRDNDVASKEYIVTILVGLNDTYTVDLIYKKVFEYVSDIIVNGKSIDEILEELPENEREYWKKLIEIGLKLVWVDNCKKLFDEGKEQILNGNSYIDVDKVLENVRNNIPLFPKI